MRRIEISARKVIEVAAVAFAALGGLITVLIPLVLVVAKGEWMALAATVGGALAILVAFAFIAALYQANPKIVLGGKPKLPEARLQPCRFDRMAKSSRMAGEVEQGWAEAEAGELVDGEEFLRELGRIP